VQIPLGKEHLDENEYNIINDVYESVMSPLVSESDVTYLTEMEDDSLNKRPVLLLVEDNIDIRVQLAANFQSKYNIKLASDGFPGSRIQ
jgi:hypothetical protein